MAERIEGLVERVTFFNEASGFAVLRLQVEGRRELATVLGSLPTVNAGEWLEAEGAWVRDPQHGVQFRAERLRSAPPNSREGIEKYLGSGLIKGVGPVLAKKLVAQFGEGVFDIIDQHSARLEEVGDIGPKRRRRIKEAWAEQKFVREIMVFLHSHGASTSRAVRIYKTYGEKAIEVVRANPYRLARDIHGIGFKTADAIGRQLGFAPESPQRAAAGLAHALFAATSEGHCALPRGVLAGQAAALLGVGEPLAAGALEAALSSGELAAEMIGGRELVYLPSLLAAEKGIAARMRRLVDQPPAHAPIDAARAAGWAEAKTGRVLAGSQREALARALNARAFIVTGGPGVGKTTLLATLLAILRAKGRRCQLCAPTGRAAQRLGEATGMEARTIHRLLEAGPGGFQRNEQRPLEADLLVVDECSMVDAPLMHALLRALSAGASLLLVGDADQLASVGPGLVLGDLLRSGSVPAARLTEIFRQAAESRIIVNAHRINAGQLPELAGEGGDFFFIEREEPERIAATVCELVRERIPRKWGLDPVRDVQVLCATHRGPIGTRALNVELQAALNPPRPGEPCVERFGWQFRPRDKVLQTANDYEREVFNGDLGIIEGIDEDEREISVRFLARTVVYGFGELDALAPALAITIHKSQGSEFPAVVIPLAASQYILLQRNLLYTAVTRGRRLVVLVGQRRALERAVREQAVRERFTGLAARLRQG